MSIETVVLEYIWVDGFEPWGLRSKSRIEKLSRKLQKSLDKNDCRILPNWGFDGSSTGQASGNNSDCILRPVYVVKDPLRKHGPHYMVLCEVLNSDGSPHETNFRSSLCLTNSKENVKAQDPWFGLEQEYTIIQGGRPLGFPTRPDHFPRVQGIYYCSAGGDRAFGREISDEHLIACIDAGLPITGTNAEVMPGQWEYQIGGPECGALFTSDALWLSRWILLLIAEKHDMTVTFDPKPELGDWNGAGCHTNFSTKKMRDPGGITEIKLACEKLKNRVDFHLSEYGSGLERRLTGAHETCSYKEFKWGIADRTASIRIPRHVATNGCGYLEDRRPNSNCDPYRVSNVILRTVCI